MRQQPTLETPRLILRPFTLADAPDVQRLAGARDVAFTTLNIPHPYEDGMAEAWIRTHQPAFEEGTVITFAITERHSWALCGAIGLSISVPHHHAEIGYWIGRPYWNQGYCTEAATGVLRYGFEELALHRIFARHMRRNPVSGRVVQKIGMTYEGRLREHYSKWGAFEDIEMYGVLREEWQQRARQTQRI